MFFHASRNSVAVLICCTVFAAFVTACSRASISPLPNTARVVDSTPALPQVWQRGTPPVQWELIPGPKTGLWDNDAYLLAWPVADRHNNVWLLAGDVSNEGTCSAAYVYNMSGAITKQINAGICGQGSGGYPNKLVIDTNGNFWYDYGRLLELSDSGAVITDYSERIPNDIAAGLNGDMWYSTSQGGYGYIVRIRSGLLHFFRLPSSTYGPNQLAVSADGNVWCLVTTSINAAAHLAKLNPSTSLVTIYPFQPLQPNQYSLYTGPDGNIWFAASSTLYRVTASSGAISRFALPHRALGHIAVGSDRTLWLDYSGANYLTPPYGLLNVSTSGTILSSMQCPTTVCNTSTGDFMNGVLAAPDGNIWTAFTSQMSPYPDGTFTPDPHAGLAIFVRLSMNVSPPSITFSGSNQIAYIKVSEAHYSGTWTSSSTQPSIVTVVKWLTSNEVEVKSLAKGTGRIIIRDSDQNYYGVSITVN